MYIPWSTEWSVAEFENSFVVSHKPGQPPSTVQICTTVTAPVPETSNTRTGIHGRTDTEYQCNHHTHTSPYIIGYNKTTQGEDG
jgi:hypothetical protein